MVRLAAVATVIIMSREEMSGLIPIVAEQGHRVIEAIDSGHVLQVVMRQRPDVVIIPDDAEPIDGEELLPVVRRLTTGPIIVVGEGQETRMANALFQGADAYLRYPISAGMLRSRLSSLLRARREPDPAEDGRNGTTRAMGLEEELALQSCPAALSPVEARLFRRLARQGGATVSAFRLAADVWGDAAGKGASLRFYIRRLRAKLESDGLLRILNRKGIGYRLEFAAGDPWT